MFIKMFATSWNEFGLPWCCSPVAEYSFVTFLVVETAFTNIFSGGIIGWVGWLSSAMASPETPIQLRRRCGESLSPILTEHMEHVSLTPELEALDPPSWACSPRSIARPVTKYCRLGWTDPLEHGCF
jgi:hypothetical protein